jgi:VCBS repeat protein
MNPFTGFRKTAILPLLIALGLVARTAGAFWTAISDFNGDGYPDYVLQMLQNDLKDKTAIWYLNNNVYVSGASGPTLPVDWSLIDAADFDGDGHTDYALFNIFTGQTAIWYLSGRTFLRGAFGPTVPTNWALMDTRDFNGDGHPDYVLYNGVTGQTAIWYLNNNVYVSGASGPPLPAGWSLLTQGNGSAGYWDYP